MRKLSSFDRPPVGRIRRQLRSWLLPALLALGTAPAARAQCSFTTAVTPAGPLALCAGSSTTLTAVATVPGFNVAGTGFGGSSPLVQAIAVQPDGKVLMGGNFTSYNGAAVSRNLVRLNADGTLDQAFNAAATGTRGFSGNVWKVAVQPDGKVLVGGNFTSYNGAADAPDHVLRLNADGSLDTSFNYTTGSTTTGASGGDVTSLALQPDGRVLVGGNFNGYNGTAGLVGVLRLNANGSLDTSFNTGGTGLNGGVYVLALQADGKIIAGGSGFTAYNGNLSAPDNLLRINANGSLDTSFNLGGAGFPAGSSLVDALAIQADNRVLVGGGNFTSYNGDASAPDNLLRINADGTLDTSFNYATTSTNGTSGLVQALALQPDGKVLVGGSGTSHNGDSSAPDYLLRLNVNGTLDTSFNYGPSTGANNSVYALALLADGRILMGGYPTTYNGADVPDCLLRVDPDGSRGDLATLLTNATYAWSNGATGSSLTVTQPGTYTATATSGGCSVASNAVTVSAASPVMVRVAASGPTTLPVGGSVTLTASATLPGFASGFANGDQVTTILAQPDGKLLVGGFFFAYNGDAAAPNYLLRLNVDGSLDKTFNYVAGSTTTGGNNYVQALALQPDGKILVGGDLSAYNGDAAAPNYVMRLNADGTLDTSFNYNGAGVDGSVLALAVQPDGKVLVGGGFASYNSNSGAPNRLLRLNADGTLDQTFNYVAGNTTNGIAGGVVRALALQADGRIVVGGSFNAYNTLVGAPNYLLRVLADGSLDTSFNYTAGSTTTGADNEVFTLLAQPDGKIVAGGFFTAYNGAADAPNHLLRLNTNGTLDTSFNYVAGSTTTGPSTTVPSSSVFVLGLARQPDGKIVVGGLFTGYNGSELAPNRLMRLNTNGSLDTSFNYAAGNTTNGADLGVDEVALLADGRVYASGVFTSYNGTATQYLLRVNADGSLNNTDQAVPGAVTYAFNPGNTSGNTRVVTSSGSYTATVTTADGCQYTSNPVAVTVATAPNLVVSTPAGIPAGTYNDITVTGTGIGTLQGNVTVNGTLLVQTGGQLLSGCFVLSGPGAFTVQAGATLAICAPEGLSIAAGTGTVQTTGPRSLSSDATYRYNGTAAQVTGNGLPGTVRELALNNATGLTLTQPLQVSRRVQLLSGNLTLNGQAMTLLSSAIGTALIDNTGGIVLGATGTMQRYIGTNTGASGYRHYSSPVQGGAGGETVGTLATAGYVPNFSGAAAYNSSATPGLVTPFPTVFAYNQNRIATAASNYSIFDKGWEAVTSGTDPMQAGRGYAVNAPGTALVDFTGTFTSGAVSQANLQRASTDPATGWHLLGNPFPSPLDWSTMTLGTGQNLENVDGAVYVFQSSGPYTGSYRTYLAAAPDSTSPIIPAGSGFFVHASTPATPGLVRFAASNRVTSFGAQPAFGRQTSTVPAVALTLTGAGTADALTLYAAPAATAGVDAAYDAVKLANPSGLNIATLTATGDALAIDGRPMFGTATVVPLRVETPVAGTYTLTTSADHLPTGLAAYLRDATTAQQQPLGAQATISLALTVGLSTRYSIVFAPAGPLATALGLTAAQVLLYPTPTHQAASVTVALPVPAGTREAQAMVINALGQRVLTSQLAVQAGQATGTLPVAGLAAGVYVVRVQAGTTIVSKRLVVN